MLNFWKKVLVIIVKSYNTINVYGHATHSLWVLKFVKNADRILSEAASFSSVLFLFADFMLNINMTIFDRISGLGPHTAFVNAGISQCEMVTSRGFWLPEPPQRSNHCWLQFYVSHFDLAVVKPCIVRRSETSVFATFDCQIHHQKKKQIVHTIWLHSLMPFQWFK